MVVPMEVVPSAVPLVEVVPVDVVVAAVVCQCMMPKMFYSTQITGLG